MHGKKIKQCKCSPQQIEKYLAKISGPLLDRVLRAREMQAQPFAGMNGTDCNARLPETLFAQYCTMEPAAEKLFLAAQKKLQVSARARCHTFAWHARLPIWMEATGSGVSMF